jgi:hypothetical protein
MLPQEAEKYNEREWAMKELVRGYIRENADEPFDTLDGEIALAWEISEGYWFVGIADGLINDRTIGLLAHEFKRTSQIAADWIARFQIDAQTTGYVMLLRENNINAKGAVLSILRATKYPEYVRDTVITPQWLIEELEAELRNIVGELEHRIEKYAVDSTLHGAMSPQALAWWPKNTSACFQYNQACPYRKLCIETPQNREVMLAEGFFKPRRAREEGILERALDRRRDAAHAERSSEEA